jgi:glycosyltransferase involved in cell wall biosynthesis
MVKRVLMIAYHYPPMRGSSGIQRTLKFSQYLPDAGWEPVVLTATPGAYQDTSLEQTREISPCVKVHRSFAFDAARHFALRGRYPALLAQPDRWVSWWLSAVPAGLRLIRKYKPDLIWSTYPIASAHLIALTLQRLTGIPWVADQRDPLIDDGYPANPRTRGIHQWIEAKAIQHGAALVFTTPGALRAWRSRFPQAAGERFALIENGYDEENFLRASALAMPSPVINRPFRLLHSGLIYPSERDPRALFVALSDLLEGGALSPSTFRLVLRASGHDDFLRPLIARLGIAEIVELAPPLPYREALAEMLSADGLLVLQASNCNGQIPAKLYEYLRARRPILALTDPAGDTAGALRQAGIDTIGMLHSSADVAAALTRFLRLCRASSAPLARPYAIAQHSRAARTLELADLFNRIRRKEAT